MPIPLTALIWLALALAIVLFAAVSSHSVHRESRIGTLANLSIRVAAVAVPICILILALPGLGETTKGLLVPAVLGAAGWLVTYLQDLDSRDRDQIDMMVALRAEIRIVYEDFRKRDPRAFARSLDQTVASALEANEDYQPFFPQPPAPLVFDALSDRVETLPSDVVERVIQFYTLLADVQRFAEDLRSDQLKGLPLVRRRPAYSNYFAMLETLDKLAARTIINLNRAMRVRDPDLGIDRRLLHDDAETGVSTPAAAPSRQGSAQDVSVGTS